MISFALDEDLARRAGLAAAGKPVEAPDLAQAWDQALAPLREALITNQGVELLRDTVIPPPRRDRAHRLHWSEWRRRHQYRSRQARERWNTYAEQRP